MEVIQVNEEFLLEKAKETFDEVIELILDAIDYLRFTIKREKSKEEYVNHAMAFFLHHILMPFSYAIHSNLLLGNLPACFMEIRVMLETLTKCYLADLKYPNVTFFQDKIQLLEKENKSISKQMKELEKRLGFKGDIVSLWGKLSNEWTHTEGIVDKIVNQIVNTKSVPPWGLVIPINYTENELMVIDSLRKRIAQFRKLLKITTEKYLHEK